MSSTAKTIKSRNQNKTTSNEDASTEIKKEIKSNLSNVNKNKKLFDEIKCIFTIILIGIVDSLSFHKCLPLLISCRPALEVVGLSLAANLGLLVGSLLIYSKGIVKVLEFIYENVVPEEMIDNDNSTSLTLFSHITWMLYHGLWILPIYILVYVCSVTWYQEIADHSFRYQKGLTKDKAIQKSISEGTFATVCWVMLYIECQILNNGVRLLIKSIRLWLDHYIIETSSTSLVIIQSMSIILQIFSYLLQFAGLVNQIMLYAWNGFDPHWIAADMSPDKRFRTMEIYWPYFIGFGLPYVLLLRLTPFFVGYGIFLALFPFCIMMGGICEYSAPFKGQTITITPISFFYIPKKMSLSLLKIFERKRKSSSSAKSSSGEAVKSLVQPIDAKKEKDE